MNGNLFRCVAVDGSVDGGHCPLFLGMKAAFIRNFFGNQIGGICVKNIAISENHLYKKVYAKGSKAVCKHIVVYVLTDYHASRLQRENPLKQRINRVGLTVSTRLGKAVVRSRVRRILRAAYPKLETERNIKKGKLIVITARDSATIAKSTDIYADLLFAAKKLSLFDDTPFKKSAEHAQGKRPEQEKK